MFVRFAVGWRACVLFVVLGLVGGRLSATCRAGDTPANLTRGPYLQLATPESMVVVWRTDGASEPIVRFGASPDHLDRQVSGDAVVLRVAADVAADDDVPRLYKQPREEAARRDRRDRDPSTAPGTYQYEAHVDGLQPGARYYYAVFDGDRRLAGGDQEHFFKTSPPVGNDASLRLWVVGDSGTAGRDQRQVFEAAQGFLHETGRKLDAYLHVGDMAYPDGTDREFQLTFFDIYQPTLRNTVCWPSMGNHEGHTSRGQLGIGPYYDAYVVPTAAEAGGVASGSEAYYSFDIGNVHFVCLDSHDLNREPTGAMAQWLVADLEEAQGDWLIAFWHHPPYTKGSHDSDREGQLIEMRTHIMPILESGGVDLVLSGHSHIYERSMLIDGAYSTPTTAESVVLDDGDGNPDGDGAYHKSEGLNPHEGTIAIVSGHGGAGISRKGTMPIMRQIIVEHGSVILDVEGDTLTGTMVNKEQVQRDVFSLVKRGQVEPTRIADPWQPEADAATITELAIAWDRDTLGESPRAWRIPDAAHGSMVVRERNGGGGREAWIAAKDGAFVAVYDGFDDGFAEMQSRVEVASDSRSPAGVVVAYQNDANYYVYRLKPDERRAEFVQCQSGREKVLTARAFDIPLEGLVKIELEPHGRVIEVQLNDELEYAIALDQPLPDGRIGVYVGPGGSATYREIEIQRESP